MNVFPIEANQIGCTLRGRQILADIQLHIAEPSIVGLIGRNGSGKSTLLKCLAGLLPISGRYSVGGEHYADLPLRKRSQLVAWQPQEMMIPFGYLAMDVVTLGRFAQHRGDPTNADRLAAEQALDAMGASNLARRPVDELSRGELQKVAIARVLASDAKMMCFDEPTASLDLASTLLFFEVAQNLRAKGVAVLIALHDISLAMRNCDFLLGLKLGRCMVSGPAEAVITAEHCRDLFDIHVEIVKSGTIPALIYHSLPS